MRVGPQAILGRLVDEQRVVDRCTRAQPGLEGPRDGFRRFAPALARGQHEAAERDIERQLLITKRDLDRRGLLREQARPSRVRAQRLLGDDPLLRLAEQVRAVAARGL